jgi:recombination protein RecR
MATIAPLERLVNALSKLPGIGSKTAQRLAYHVVAQDEGWVRELAESIYNAKKKTAPCPVCGALSEVGMPCALCEDPRRRRDILLVVENMRDVVAMERARDYNGLYHVLGGVLSPMEGIGPDSLRFGELMDRLKDGEIKEVVLATDPDVEGEATAAYIGQLLRPLGVKVTRIAHGVPVGGELEYTDELTLNQAFRGRREL